MLPMLVMASLTKVTIFDRGSMVVAMIRDARLFLVVTFVFAGATRRDSVSSTLVALSVIAARGVVWVALHALA